MGEHVPQLSEEHALRTEYNGLVQNHEYEGRYIWSAPDDVFNEWLSHQPPTYDEWIKRKKETMTVSRKESDKLREQALALLERANVLDERAQYEPESDGTVVSWVHKFPGNDKEYEYVAIKRGGLWWDSSTVSSRGRSWQSLAGQYPALTEGDFYIVTKWTHRKDM